MQLSNSFGLLPLAPTLESLWTDTGTFVPIHAQLRFEHYCDEVTEGVFRVFQSLGDVHSGPANGPALTGVEPHGVE